MIDLSLLIMIVMVRLSCITLRQHYYYVLNECLTVSHYISEWQSLLARAKAGYVIRL
jgi:hypothetical protein